MYGVYTALITPFIEDKIDENILIKILSFQIEEGVDGILILGSTGEGELLSWDERRIVMEIARETIGGMVPLMVQTGDMSTSRTIEKTNEAERLGADGVLVVSPYFCCPNQDGIFSHFKDVAKNSGLPIVIYNNPSRSCVGLTIDTISKLSEIDNIVGIKDSSDDLSLASQIINDIGGDFKLISGDDILTFPLSHMGARGTISAVSNVFPKKIHDLFHNPTREKYREMFPFFKLAKAETNPILIKAMMKIIGMDCGFCRPPLTRPLEKNICIAKNLLLN